MAKKKSAKEKTPVRKKPKVEMGMSHIAIPRSPRTCVVGEFFSEGGINLFSYVDADVAKFFGADVKPRAGYECASYTLSEEMDDESARRLMPGARAMDMAAIRYLISLQPKGGTGELSGREGNANCFLMPSGRVEVVWEGKKWGIWAFKGKLPGHMKWPKGTRFFYRPRA